MVSQSVPADAATPTWWRRMLAAEREALLGGSPADERMLWLSVAGAVSEPRAAGVLDLVVHGERLGGDLQAASSEWPLRDDSFDRVVLQHALEAADDAQSLLDEALRVLKPERGIAVLAVGAMGWTRLKLHFADCGAPPLRVQPLRALLDALVQRGCVDLRVSRVDFDGSAQARVSAPARLWSGLCLVEARKRRELPNVRPLRARGRSPAAVSGWVARPTSRSGLAA